MIIQKYKWTILLSTGLLAIIAVFFLGKIRINSDIESYLPAHISSKINNDSIEHLFTKRDPLMIVFECEDVLNYETLIRLQKINNEFIQMPEFNNIISIFETKEITGDGGMMLVEPLIREIVDEKDAKEALRKKISKNQNVYKHLVSEDFKYTFLLLNSTSEKPDKEVIDLVYKTLKEHAGNEKVFINGPLYMRTEANDKISRDFMYLLPLGLLIMVFFLFLSFRQKRGVLLPFAVVIFSILISLALIPIFNWSLSIIGILVPVMMIAIANDYGIHFITKYQELSETKPNSSEKTLALKTTNYLKKPILVTGLTTIVGLMGLALHVMLPAKQMAIITSIGIGMAILLSLTFIPATIIAFNKKSNGTNFISRNNNRTNILLKRISHFILKKPKLVIILFSSFLLITAFGFLQFALARDFDNILHKKHPYTIALNIADEHFGGTKNISVLFEGDIKDPELLKRLKHYESELEKMPEIGSVTSISSIIKEMSKAMLEPSEDGYNNIPGSRQAVAQYLELYNMSGDPEDLEDFVDFDYRNALLEIQFKNNDKNSINKIINRIEQLVEKDENYRLMGGYCLIEKQLSDEIAKGQLYSLLFALIVIIILLAIIFKNLIAGLIGGIPLLFTIIATFGIMGWTNIELNIVTALLSSISIGLGVDYTIHIFWRIKKEIKEVNSLSKAIINSIRTAGYGITINAFSVIIGFSVLLISSFGIIRSFAFLIMLSIFFCLLCSLVLIPAICYLFKPKFLYK